ncbi:hypothetical protein LEP1GSC008_0783 [Leptospira kirschneri serovar Bulgarica str. Nikolaevo]|uniref:Uncharacterized protein n=1 Tax=Leptospira kirschneri serovar Bulgarica str. Nikolaevo TaxID=1240687 RepID=M6FER1_9LEPT|nr:hypothetical protein LEP1GSC008_0783 [Leptospira kirschneri serovar Bulgarica str. Nikolaevo]
MGDSNFFLLLKRKWIETKSKGKTTKRRRFLSLIKEEGCQKNDLFKKKFLF